MFDQTKKSSYLNIINLKRIILIKATNTMADSKQPVVLNVAPTIDQINADRITQVYIR